MATIRATRQVAMQNTHKINLLISTSDLPRMDIYIEREKIAISLPVWNETKIVKMT